MMKTMTLRSLDDDDDDDGFGLPVCLMMESSDSKGAFVEIVSTTSKTRKRGNRVFRVKESKKVTERNSVIVKYPCCDDGEQQLVFHQSFPELRSVRLEPINVDRFDVDRMPPISYIKFRLRDHPLHCGSLIRVRLRDGKYQIFSVNTTTRISNSKHNTGIVSSNTLILIPHNESARNLHISEHPSSSSSSYHIYPSPPIDAIGTIKIRERFRYSLEMCLGLRRSRIKLLRENPTRAILVSGPSGVGKKTLIRMTLDSVASKQLMVCCIWIRPEHLLISPSGIEGDASAGIASVPQRLVRLFRTASRIQPCVVVIESIEDIFASPSSSSSSTNISKQDKRSRMEIQVTISNLLKSYPHVILIGISSRMHMLTYTSLGIFSEHIALSLPDASQRAIALKYHLSNSSSTINSTTTTDNIREKARSCHAFVLRDMEFVAKEVKHGKKSLDDAICNIKSSLLSPSFSVSVPNVSWNVVGGVNEAKRALEEAVIWPTTRSEDLKRMGVKPPRGILLVGPPGVGKTLLAKAVATASKSHFLTASVSSLVDAASGESAAKIRDLFSVARQCAPSVVFLDEFQALFGTRDGGSSHSRQLISQLLMEFDQSRYHDDDDRKRVFVLAATNVPNAIDRAFFTPGRFDLVLRMNLPTCQGRVDILKGLKQRFSNSWPIEIEDLAKRTVGYSGADLASVLRFAVLFAARRSKDNGSDDDNEIMLKGCDFENALKHVKASVDDSQLALCGLKRLRDECMHK